MNHAIYKRSQMQSCEFHMYTILSTIACRSSFKKSQPEKTPLLMHRIFPSPYAIAMYIGYNNQEPMKQNSQSTQ